MSQRLKCCYICQKSDHLQAKCPDAFWSQRKKAAQLNSAHTSAHQQKPVAKKAAVPKNTIPAEEANENNVDTVKEATTAFLTAGIIPAATACMPTDSTSVKEASDSPSLNCRHLLKVNNPQLADSFIRHLKGQDLDVFVSQETIIPSLNFNDRIAMLDLKFQSFQSIWTSKCGLLLNFNRNLHMEKILKSDDDRIIFAKFTLPAEPDLFPLYVLNLYTSADSPQSRTVFYNELMDYVKSLDSYGDILERLILAGDFNFQYDIRLPDNEPRKRPSAFAAFTDTFLHDCNNNYSDPLFKTLPTFWRGNAIKTLDYYIMVGCQLKNSYFDNDIEYIASTGTDDALLKIEMRLHQF